MNEKDRQRRRAAVIYRRTNELAHEILRLQGYRATYPQADFRTSRNPRMLAAWAVAVLAQEFLCKHEMADIVSLLEEASMVEAEETS